MILDVVKVSKVYNKKVVLNKVSFSLYKNEILGIYGPNGSGKTTLINVISGLVKPTAGSVIFDRKDISNFSIDKIVRNGIARTFQIPMPNPLLTVRETILIPLFSKNKGSKIEDVDEILKLTRLYKQKDMPTTQLSQGCLRRLEVARIFALKPMVVLLDEIFSSLSIHDEEEMKQLVLRLKENDKCSIIITSHSPRILTEVSDRALYLEDGEKIKEGGTFELLSERFW